ncbi:MAG TPA: hypothetical protein VHA54_09305 [Solirubrobacterales bacterium]|nr:hypothetical protein [Solirubrobacterales bacterium]
MEQMRSTWTDSRLDDLNERVSELGRRVDVGFARVDGRIDSLQRTIIHAVIGIMAAMLTGFAGLAGLIVTQL